jgi:hypothetical protein
MKKIIGESLFFIAAAVVILPAPTLLFAWITGQTIRQVLYR